MSELDQSRSSRRRFLAGIGVGAGSAVAATTVAYTVIRNDPIPQPPLGGTQVTADPNPRLFSFVGGDRGSWRVTRITPYVGEPLPDLARLDIVNGTIRADGGWVLRGVSSNERYTTRPEKTEHAAKQVGLGRPTATHAALIPIRKNAAGWALAQDERRRSSRTNRGT